ncbi:MAG: hypothetical protein WEF86_14285 [Gemmatimonadota bacterium]
MDGEGVTEAVLADWRTAPVREELRAMLGFLEKLTLDPQTVTTADMGPLRAAGLADEAIADAIHVCAAFNVVDRIADSFEFHVPPADEFRRGASGLLKRGYA